MFARVLFFVANTCCFVLLSQSIQLWDAEGLSQNLNKPVAPEARDFHLQVSNLLFDILNEDYEVELTADQLAPKNGLSDRRRRDDPRALGPPQQQNPQNGTESKEAVAVKCCPMGQILFEKNDDGNISSVCAPSNLTFQPVFYAFNSSDFWPFDSNEMRVIVDNPCKFGKYKLDLDEPEEQFYLLTNGTLFMPKSPDKPFLGMNDFCMEVFWDEKSEKTGEGITFPFVCFPPGSNGVDDPVSRTRLVIIAIVMLISVPLLILTAIAFLITPQLRETHGRALANYCLCLSAAFLALATTQLVSPQPRTIGCTIAAVFIQLSFFGCFVWLTIMCYDIYRHIRNNLLTGVDYGDEKRISKWYPYIGWSVPILLVAITYGLEYAPGIPLFLHKPFGGSKGCWFQTDVSALLYFYGPVAFLLSINVAFFFMSVRSLAKQEILNTMNGQTEILNPHNSDFHSRKNKYKRLAKKSFILSLMMGLSWTLDVLSWLIGGNEWKWLAFDLVNAGQGIIIFGIYMNESNRHYFFTTLREKFPWMTFLPSSDRDLDVVSEMTNIGCNGTSNHIANV